MLSGKFQFVIHTILVPIKLFCKFAVKLNNILKWDIITTETALTAHVVVDDLSCWPKISEHLKHELEEHGIAHATLEPETEECHCHNREC